MSRAFWENILGWWYVDNFGAPPLPLPFPRIRRWRLADGFHLLPCGYSIRMEGLAAFYQGKWINACPYTDRAKKKLWLEGWSSQNLDRIESLL